MDANPRDTEGLSLSQAEYAELADIAYVTDCLNMAFDSFFYEISDTQSADSYKHLLHDITARLHNLVNSLEEQTAECLPSDSSVKIQNFICTNPTIEEINKAKKLMETLKEKTSNDRAD